MEQRRDKKMKPVLISELFSLLIRCWIWVIIVIFRKQRIAESYQLFANFCLIYALNSYALIEFNNFTGFCNDIPLEINCSTHDMPLWHTFFRFTCFLYKSKFKFRLND